MNTIVIKIIEVLPSLLWAGIAFWVLKSFLPNFLKEILPRLQSFKGFGIEAELATDRISQLATIKSIEIDTTSRESLKKRLELTSYSVRRSRILWVDDNPDNNSQERLLLEGLGAEIKTELNTAAGLRSATEWRPDLVISDMGRPESPTAGIELAEGLVSQSNSAPVVVYTSPTAAEMTSPTGIFGITARPDELIHLILDILERKRL